MSPHRLTNFDIQKYYQNETKFKGFYSRNNIPKIKDGTYIRNIYEQKSIGAYSIAFYVNCHNVTYLDSFQVEYILNKKNYRKKYITTMICEVQSSH